MAIMPSFRRTFTYQPLKAIIVITAAFATFLKLPYWLVIYLYPAFRPCQRWSYFQALRIRLLRSALWVISQIELKTPESLEGFKRADAEFVLIAPPALSLAAALGPLSCDSSVKPRTIGGTWYPSLPSSSSLLSTEQSDQKCVILHLHGGAYIAGTGRPDDCGYLAALLLKNTPASHIWVPQYRLASNVGNPFPAALQDAVTSLFYLVHTLHYSMSEITLSGDSAGGNLALALARWVEEFGVQSGLSKPRESGSFNAIVIMSLWADPFTVIRHPGYLSSRLQERTDYLNEAFGAWGARGLGLCSDSSSSFPSLVSSCTSAGDVSKWEHYLNFSGPSRAFKTKSRIWFEMGECEVLFETQMAVWKAFEQLEGNSVSGSVQPAAPHDIMYLGAILGFDEQAKEAAIRVGTWMRAESRKL